MNALNPYDRVAGPGLLRDLKTITPFDFQGANITERIQAAVDAAWRMGGGKVVLTDVFPITSSIIARDNVLIEASRKRRGGLRKAPGSGEFSMIYKDSVGTLTNFHLKDLMLDGNRKMQVDAEGGRPIQLNLGSLAGLNISIEGCEICHFTSASTGVSISGVDRLDFYDNLLYDGAGAATPSEDPLHHGIYFNRCRAVRVVGNTSYDMGGNAYKVSGGASAFHDALIANNIAYRCNHGYAMTGMDEVRCIGNYAEDMLGSAFIYGGDNMAPEGDAGLSFVGNQVLRADIGLRHGGLLGEASIIGNRFIDCWFSGVKLRNVARTYVALNTFRNMTERVTNNFAQILQEDAGQASHNVLLGNVHVSDVTSGERYAVKNDRTGRNTLRVVGPYNVAGSNWSVEGGILLNAPSDTELRGYGTGGSVNVSGVPVFADDAAAQAGGIATGCLYRKSDGTLAWRVS